MPALALTDHDGLYGMVRFVMEAREAGIQPIVGAELTTDGGGHLTLLVQDASGFSNLCRLISRSQLDHSKGEASLAWEQLEAHHRGLIALSGGRSGDPAPGLAGCARNRPALCRPLGAGALLH
jgi:error-prone DNA polymerase